MKQRILVVEDHPANRELLCDWLEAEGFEAVTAGTLELAFSVCKNQLPEAVLLDVQLGSEDGLVFAAWVREQPSAHEIPVIAVTAHAMVADQERVMEAGCHACISKPIDFKLLREELRRWLSAGSTPSKETPAGQREAR